MVETDRFLVNMLLGYHSLTGNESGPSKVRIRCFVLIIVCKEFKTPLSFLGYIDKWIVRFVLVIQKY